MDKRRQSHLQSTDEDPAEPVADHVVRPASPPRVTRAPLAGCSAGCWHNQLPEGDLSKCRRSDRRRSSRGLAPSAWYARKIWWPLGPIWRHRNHLTLNRRAPTDAVRQDVACADRQTALRSRRWRRRRQPGNGTLSSRTGGVCERRAVASHSSCPPYLERWMC